MCGSVLPSVRHWLPSPGSVKLLTSLVGTWHGPDFCGELEGDSKEKCEAEFGNAMYSCTGCGLHKNIQPCSGV